MSDSCSYVSRGECDTLELYQEKDRKARKTHKCTECFREIVKGEVYRECSGMCDGYFSRYKICSDCASLLDAYFCEGVTFEEMWDDMREHVRSCCGDIPIPVDILTPTARDKVCDLIEWYWSHYEKDFD